MPQWILENYTLIIIMIGTLLLGSVAGLLGVFSILRNEALAGDALSHAALPGVVLAYIVTNQRSIPILLIGAALSALVSMLLIHIIKKYSKTKSDASLALILSSFFGLGQVLLQVVQNKGASSAAGLNKFIFGQAATMLKTDVYFIAGVSMFVLLIIILLWKEIKLHTFNEEFFASLGFSKRIMNILMTIITVIVVVIGIRTVGVILMSALIIAPGVAARQWSHKLSINALIATLIGLFSGIIGTYISYLKSNLPTGPVIVIVLSIFVIISLLFAPKRGLIRKTIDLKKHQKNIEKYRYLIHLYSNEETHLTQETEAWIQTEHVYLNQNKQPKLTEKGVFKVESILKGGSHV